ncbi:MAG: rod shape-determining protein MreC [Myxococcaceae bacterium]|nr:rod shape-determining protein MreC [Myxococcaceae bacterium]
MRGLFGRYRDVFIVGALLVFPFVTFLSSGHKGRDPNVVDRVVLAVAAPIQGALTWLVDGVGDGVDGYLTLRGAREEARACTVELSQTRAELNTLREASLENERLRKLLGYVERSVDTEIAARVVGVNPSPQFLSVRLSRGESDGVHVGMPVVTPDGVLGQVVRTVSGSADVMLLSDPVSRVGAVLQRTRVRATVVGTGDGKRLALENTGRDADVQANDVVVTSGTDGIFPKGLVLGTVEAVQRAPSGLFLSAQLAPAVVPGTVEEVLVVPAVAAVPPAALLPQRSTP